MAHQIVWCSAATVDPRGRPRSRILHPIWQWDGTSLLGWVATTPTPLKRAHLQASPFMSINYWAPSQDSCLAECRAELVFDHAIREMVWNLFLEAAPPVGYDPAIIPTWKSPTSEAFVALRLQPWRVRVFPGSMFFGKGGQLLTWNE